MLTIQSSTTYPDGRKLEQTAIWSLDDKGRLIMDVTDTMSGEPPRKERVVATKR